MILLKDQKDLPQFLNLVSSQKQNFSEWSYFHVDFSKSPNFKINDIIDYISVRISDPDATLIHFSHVQVVLMIFPNSCRTEVAEFDRHIHDSPALSDLKTTMGPLHPNNIQEFGRFIAATITNKDVASQIGLKRALRSTNKIMVLDDDIVVTKQAEMALKELGEVYCMNTAQGFIEEYVEFAPDILFLDIHLKNVRGTEFVDKLIGTVDPFAHIVMISSDTMKKTIMDLRFTGTKGFIMKPFNREQLHQHVKRSVSYCP